MKLIKPKFWDKNFLTFQSILLYPFTFILDLRNLFLYFCKTKKYDQIKTICIGNIYLGGTGKTPLTIKMYQIIKMMGLNVVTAKKFYSNQFDEQILLKEKTRTIISDSRLNAINQALNKSKEVIIFDDGLQDKDIDYDLKIVCFKNKNWIGNGQLIPSGPLREKIESLKKYDVVFLNGRNENSKSIIEIIHKKNSNIKIFDSYYEINNFNELKINSKYLIFSGIGDPSSFREILLEKKINIVKEIIFPDHYNYKENDLKYIIEEAHRLKAEILTTEKDFVKLSDHDNKKINFLKIELKIVEEQNFMKFLNDKLYR